MKKEEGRVKGEKSKAPCSPLVSRPLDFRPPRLTLRLSPSEVLLAREFARDRR
jgi:hypothetical protein